MSKPLLFTSPQAKASALTRVFKRLHSRGLIAKIPRTYRWRTTAEGQRLLSNSGFPYLRE